jgi:hypothetical protein
MKVTRSEEKASTSIVRTLIERFESDLKTEKSNKDFYHIVI